jgi:hypothetical protein
VNKKKKKFNISLKCVERTDRNAWLRWWKEKFLLRRRKMKTKLSMLVMMTMACMSLSAVADLDAYYYSGGWNSVPINTNGYAALTDEQSNGNYLYGAKSTGGLDIGYHSGSWQTYNIAAAGTTSYKAVSNLSGSLQVAAAGTGGLDTYGFDGSNWVFGTHVNSNSYTAVARNGDDATYDTIFALRSGGGLDRMNTVGGWNTSAVNSTSYLDITDDPIAVNQLYASKAAGGIDAIVYSGGWTTVSILTSGQYVSLVAEKDPLQSNRLWGAKAGGGIDAIWFNGSAWQTAEIISGTQYVDLADHNGAASQLYGVRADGKLDVISYGNSWAATTLGTGYNVVATDNAVGYGNVFAASIPEPATLMLLGLGTIALRRFRK